VACSGSGRRGLVGGAAFMAKGSAEIGGPDYGPRPRHAASGELGRALQS